MTGYLEQRLQAVAWIRADPGLLDRLPPREAGVLVGRLGLMVDRPESPHVWPVEHPGTPESLEETGRRWGVSREWARQIQKSALAWLEVAVRVRDDPAVLDGLPPAEAWAVRYRLGLLESEAVSSLHVDRIAVIRWGPQGQGLTARAQAMLMAETAAGVAG